MRVAVFGVPGGWSTERLARALTDLGAEALVVDPAACSVRLPDPRVFLHGRPLPALDGVIVKKLGDPADGWAVQERISVLRHLAASGVPVVSPPDRLAAAVNRYRMTVELARAGLPVPETVVTEDPAEAAETVSGFGTAVLKPLFTSKGRGMERLQAAIGLPRFFADRRARGGGPFYLQRFIAHPGRDLSVAVLDGRYMGAYWRVGRPDRWMTTILSGGRYEAADPPPDVAELALRAARHFGLLFTGVDLMETPAGDFVVLEVSAFGGFRGLLTACGVDAASALATAALARFEEVRR